uniref:hypothetical protein n=1 Tax=Alistipes sp. D31t1_170403_E11 TaxID=2787128 RepID=UPI00189783EC|nr:hypothetical protein [Alistipes sp. D31t1_170403_E11]
MRLIIILIWIFFVGCSQRQVRKELELLNMTAIYIPSNMEIVQNGQLSDSLPKKIVNDIKLVIYNTSDGCTPCRVSHLYDFEKLFKIDSQKRFAPIIIFAPESDKYHEVITLLEQQSFEFPVYIDKLNELRKKNTQIPSDTRFHTFLLDKKNKVVLVGNPIYSDAMWSLFKSTLDNMLAHDGVYVPEK